MSKHTPGPWEVGGLHRPFDRDIIGPNGEDIGFVNCSDGADEPTFYPFEANARLMASAPALLAEVRQCAVELQEAANIIAATHPRTAEIFAHAAARTRDAAAQVEGNLTVPGE